jgi:hypothetical protein
MSALLPKADMCGALAHVRYGPKAHIQACCEAPLFRISNEHSSAGQNDPDFGELAELGIDVDCAGMLLDDDVVTDGEAKAGAFSSRFGREERVEHLFFHVRRDASAVIADPDFYTIAKVFGRRSEGRLVVAVVCFRSTLGRCMEGL